MVFVSFVIILAILLALAEDNRSIKKGMSISFWLIVIIFSLRYEYGNDYKSYENWFNNIISYSSLFDAIHERKDIETGWVILNYLCNPLGFQVVIAITTFCVSYIYYYLIKNYVPRPYRWVGVLIFLMYPNLFMLNLSMLRQGLAGALFFISFIKGYEGKWKQSIIFCLLAISVHQVALICIPFVLMINLKRYINPKILVLGVIVAFVTFVLYSNYIEDVYDQILSNDFANESYSNYMSREGSKDVSLALFSRIVVIIPSLIWYKKLTELDKYLTIMFCVSPFMILLSTQNTLLLRLECFFLPFSTLIFPRLLSKGIVFEKLPKNWNTAKPIMIIASVGWMLFSIRSFFSFFSEPIYAKHYATFQTVLSAIVY